MKNKMSSKLALSVSFLLLGGFVSLVKAEPPAPPQGATEASQMQPANNEMSKPQKGRYNKKRKAARMMHKGLDLTSEQKKSVQDMRAKLKPQMQALMAKLGNVRNELRMLSLSPKFNEEKARELSNAQGELVADLFFMQSKMQNEVYKLLTPEQREKLKEMPAGPKQPKGANPPPPPPANHP